MTMHTQSGPDKFLTFNEEMSWHCLHPDESLPGGSLVQNPPANAGDARDMDWSLCQKDPLEKSMATHSSILAWKIPWAEEPGRLQSTGWQRIRHN